MTSFLAAFPAAPQALRAALEAQRPLVDQAEVERDLATIHAQLEPDAYAAGQALSFEQGVEAALFGDML